MEYYAGFKKEILAHVATWMNLEDNILSEITQTQKDKHYTIPLTRGTPSSHIHRDRKSNSGCQWLGEAKVGGYHFRGREFQFHKWKKSGDGWWWWSHNNMNILDFTERKIFKNFLNSLTL